MTSISKPVDNLIASKDRAETFAESDVSVSTNDTGINQESISLIDPFGGTSINFSGDNSTSNGGETVRGFIFTPVTDLGGVSARIESSNGTANEVRLEKQADGTVLDSVTNTSVGETVKLESQLSQGTEYRLVMTIPGGVSGFTSTTSLPVDSPEIDVTDGYYLSEFVDNGRDADVHIFDQATGLLPGKLSGSATVEWPAPDDVYRWDAATFQQSSDGGSVKVYIEESTDDGSTWTEISGPISRGDQINADPNSRVRFRVDLSRSSTNNSPSLDSIYRRWVV